MFHFQQQDQSIRLFYHESVVLDGIEVAAKLQDGQEIPLRPEPAAAADHAASGRIIVESAARFTFVSEHPKDANGRVTAHIDAVRTGSHIAVYVRAAIHNKELFRDRVNFAPFEGITIRVRTLPGLEAVMANYQHKDWWTRPFFTPDIRKLPKRTLSLLWKTQEQYYHALPVTDKLYRTDLCGGGEGMRFRVSAYQGGFNSCDTLAFVVGGGTDPYALAAESTRTAMEASDSPARPRTQKTYPEKLDYLGWCSWDAFYHAVDADGLLKKTEELHALGLPVRWVMIDDGWSEVREKRLRTYDAVKSKFPGGLAPVIAKMKQEHGVKWVGVWHTIAGYWGGVDPEGELFENNRQHLFETAGGVWVPAPDAAAAFGFWNDWHGYLKRQGVDFVKVDSQSAVANFFTGLQPIGKAAEAAHTALEASVGLHFDGCVINCMGMASENIWHRPSSSLSRNSDDFVPEEKSGFKEHAIQNAYNSFFHGTFYWGDWDMYWTDNHDDKQNMVLRSVSGGPIYFSDKLGRTKAEHVWPLIYRDGRIIRCDEPGAPTADCLMTDPTVSKVPLKVWNRVGENGVLAAFHIHESDADVEGSFGPSDVPGLAGSSYWVYDRQQEQVYRMDAEERKPLQLRDMEAGLFLILPERQGVGATPIGLTDKLVSVAAVLSCTGMEERTVVRLREGGRFAFAADRKPSSVLVNGRQADAVAFGGNGYAVDCSNAEGEVIVEMMFGGMEA